MIAANLFGSGGNKRGGKQRKEKGNELAELKKGNIFGNQTTTCGH
jgi:hypothetical protein